MSEQSRTHEIDRPQHLRSEQIIQAGSELLEYFDIKIDPVEECEEFKVAMNELNPRFQGERELVRYELEKDQTEWPQDAKDLIMRTAEGMRMLETETPLRGAFDLVVVLGGARQSNLDRANFVAEALSRFGTYADKIIVAGTNRKLSDAEKENVANYAPEAETEADLCASAVEKVEEKFRFNRGPYHGYWKEDGEYKATEVFEPLTVEVKDGEEGTPQVIRAAIKKYISEIPEDEKRSKGNFYPGGPWNLMVGVVTTQIYQAYTQLDLESVGAEFGMDNRWSTQLLAAGSPSDPKAVEARTPATYLSEICRTLRAAASEIKSTQEIQKKEAQKREWDNAMLAPSGEEPQFGGTYRRRNGDEVVVEDNGTEWTRYSSREGLIYDGPGDDPGQYP